MNAYFALVQGWFAGLPSPARWLIGAVAALALANAALAVVVAFPVHVLGLAVLGWALFQGLPHPKVGADEETKYPKYLGGVIRNVPENHALVLRNVWGSDPQTGRGYSVFREGWRVVIPWVLHDVVGTVSLAPLVRNPDKVQVNTQGNNLVDVDYALETRVGDDDMDIVRYVTKVPSDGKGDAGRNARREIIESQVAESELNLLTSVGDVMARDSAVWQCDLPSFEDFCDPRMSDAARERFRQSALRWAEFEVVDLDSLTGIDDANLQAFNEILRWRVSRSLEPYGLVALRTTVQKFVPPAEKLAASERKESAKTEVEVAAREAEALGKILEVTRGRPAEEGKPETEVRGADPTYISIAYILRDALQGLGLTRSGQAPTKGRK